MKQLMLLCSVLFAVQPLQAALPAAADPFPREVQYNFVLPFDTFTNGDGFVFPIFEPRHDQGAEVTVVAIPARGYIFSSWQRVNVLTFTEYTVNGAGQPNPPIITTVYSPIPEYRRNAVLRFVPNPQDVIYNDPSVGEIAEQAGWQANFVPWQNGEQGQDH
jgi:hypothetical protein